MDTTLIVTEKPDAARHVAEALSPDSHPRRVDVNGVPFFEVQSVTERLIVCSALGHLYVVAEKRAGGKSSYPAWDYEWKPKYLVDRSQRRQERWIKAIAKVSKDADRFVDACDFDLEGSLIGYTILKYACDGAEKQARRMKFSTLTRADLQNAYASALPHLDFNLIEAGMCRHEVDWLFGINLSRALTRSAHRHRKRYSTLSTGRVQGPTLKFVVEREEEIQTFVPVPYWSLRITIKIGTSLFPADYRSDRIRTESEARRVVQSCRGKLGSVEKLSHNAYDISPPTPFDLSTLQKEAYTHFHLSPRITLSIAERLYLNQLISYPRTSSQKLPPSIGYRKILENLGRIANYRQETIELLKLARLNPNEGRNIDPAHPAVYPTGFSPSRRLENSEQKLFDLIVRRFLATFGEKAVKRSERATITVGDYSFLLSGSRIIESGWVSLYKPYAKFEDTSLPPLTVGQGATIHEIKPVEKFTQPPSRYNPGSLLRQMEESKIGTKATRADIIETLYRRGYVMGQSMRATPLAFRVVEILTKHCPKIVNVGLTKDLEAKMERIENGSERRESVIHDTMQYLKPAIETFKLNEEEIGDQLAAILDEMLEESTTLNTTCPQCTSPLRIVRNPRTRKRFIGCAGKWKNRCNYSLPLPQLGAITLLQKSCPICGFQLVQVSTRGRRRLVSCSRCYVSKMSRAGDVEKPVPTSPRKVVAH